MTASLPDLSDVVSEVLLRQQHLGLFPDREVGRLYLDDDIARLVAAAEPWAIPDEALELMAAEIHPLFPLYPWTSEPAYLERISLSDEWEELFDSLSGRTDRHNRHEADSDGPRWPLLVGVTDSVLLHAGLLASPGHRTPLVSSDLGLLAAVFPSLRTALMATLVAFDFVDELQEGPHDVMSSGLPVSWATPGYRWQTDAARDAQRRYDAAVAEICAKEESHPLWPPGEPPQGETFDQPNRSRWAAWLAGYGTTTPLPSDP